MLLIFPPTQVGPQGVVFNAASSGPGKPTTSGAVHFTAVQVLSDATGTFLGTVTIDGYPEVSEDGQTFIDDGSRVTVTIRDAAGAIVDQIPRHQRPAGDGDADGPGHPRLPGRGRRRPTPTS